MKNRTTPLMAYFWVIIAIVCIMPTIVEATPDRITNLKVTMETSTTLTVTWIAPQAGNGYTLTSNDVRMSTSPINALNWNRCTRLDWLDDAVGTPGHTNTATFTGLATNTAYYVAMKVQDSSGTWTVPSNLALGRTTTSGGTVILLWSPSPSAGVGGYALYASTNLSNLNLAINFHYTIDGQRLDCGNITSSTFTNLIPGMTYYFTVSAYSASAGYEAFSEVIEYTIPEDP